MATIELDRNPKLKCSNLAHQIQSYFSAASMRDYATASRIKVSNPVVDLDGDEMTR